MCTCIQFAKANIPMFWEWHPGHIASSEFTWSCGNALIPCPVCQWHGTQPHHCFYNTAPPRSYKLLEELKGHSEVSLELLISRLNKSSSLSLSSQKCFGPLIIFTASLQQVHAFLVLKTPELNMALQVRSQWSGVERENPPQGRGPLPCCPRGFWCSPGHNWPSGLQARCWLTSSFLSTRTPMSPSTGLPSTRSPCLYSCLDRLDSGAAPCTWTPSLERFSWAHLLTLPRSLWMVSHPSVVNWVASYGQLFCT